MNVLFARAVGPFLVGKDSTPWVIHRRLHVPRHGAVVAETDIVADDDDWTTYVLRERMLVVVAGVEGVHVMAEGNVIRVLRPFFVVIDGVVDCDAAVKHEEVPLHDQMHDVVEVEVELQVDGVLHHVPRHDVVVSEDGVEVAVRGQTPS